MTEPKSKSSQTAIRPRFEYAAGRVACPHCGAKAYITDYHFLAQYERFKVLYNCHGCHNQGALILARLPREAARDYSIFKKGML